MIRNLIILILFSLLMVRPTYAQENQTSPQDMIEVMNEYLETAEAHFSKKNYSSAAETALESYRIATNLQNKYGEASASLMLSRIYREQKNYYESLDFGLRCLNVSHKISPENELTATLSLLQLYKNWGAWSKMLECIKLAEELAQGDAVLLHTLEIEKYKASYETHNIQQAIWILESLIYTENISEKKFFLSESIRLKRMKGDQGGALKDGMALFKVLEKSGNDFEKALCENNLGSIYLDLSEYAYAVVHCENALHYRNDGSPETGATLLNLASALFKDNQTTRALSTLELADGIFIQYAQKKEHSLVFALKARILSAIGDYNGAMIAANQSLNYSQQTDDLILQSQIYSLLSSLTKKTGDVLISQEFSNKASMLKLQAEKNRREQAIISSELLLSISNKEKVVLSTIAASEEETRRLQQQLLQTTEANKLAQLKYENDLREAALLNEQSARENALNELELVKAALMSEQQLRTISDLEKDKTAQQLKVNELSFAEQEKEKGIQLLKHQNDLLASEQKLKETEFEKEIANRKIRNMFIGLLIVLTIMASIALLITHKKNKIIRSSNQRVKQINEVLRDQNEEIISSIHYARNFQDTIIPAEETIRSFVKESFLIYKPLDIVSGDIPFIVRKDNELYVGAIDCIGHGVPAAMLSFMAYYNLNELIQEQPHIDCGKMLAMLHDRLSESMKKRYANPNFAAGIDIGLCRIDLTTFKMQFAGANLPLLIVSNGDMEKIKGDYHSVGDIYDKKQSEYVVHYRQLKSSDRIYLLSDGFVHQIGGENGSKKFSMKRLASLLQSIHNLPMQAVREKLSEAFEEWKGQTNQTDDIVLIGIELNQNPT